MRNFLPIVLASLLFAACNPTEPEPQGTTISFTESDSIFPNPERGLFVQIYYTSADLNSHANAATINKNRNSAAKLSLYLHSYYLTDYMESDIPQEFLDRLETNMNALREGGAKVVLRFSYKSSMDRKDQPWNASAEWIHKHIDQIAPYLKKHADVIYCVQCGWLGSWGEWYYVDSGFKFNPSKDDDFVPRWEVLEHMMRAVPESRQIALRIPAYKMRWLKMQGDTAMSPLTEAEAHNGSIKARICGHNDCFVSSSNDVGTYGMTYGNKERDFWAEDTKYTIMGGETCEKTKYSEGPNALKEMAKYHWSYLNRDYRESVTSMWRQDGTMDTILTRLGYRLVLEKAILTPKPKVGQEFKAYFVLHNVGFAAPMNKRDVELILVNASDASKKYVFPQESVDPRFWLPEEEHKFTLACTLNDMEPGNYKLYLNLPDPYESIHNDPRFSIRIANENMWEAETGYNYIATINVE
ncbi:MAG: DUF4832 domain-containing protein [Paludibacteraceae bacterium]|nr:DUF4832 domain-containing protein [Paludibacteraceae bacterium]